MPPRILRPLEPPQLLRNGNELHNPPPQLLRRPLHLPPHHIPVRPRPPIRPQHLRQRPTHHLRVLPHTLIPIPAPLKIILIHKLVPRIMFRDEIRRAQHDPHPADPAEPHQHGHPLGIHGAAPRLHERLVVDHDDHVAQRTCPCKQADTRRAVAAARRADDLGVLELEGEHEVADESEGCDAVAVAVAVAIDERDLPPQHGAVRLAERVEAADEPGRRPQRRDAFGMQRLTRAAEGAAAAALGVVVGGLAVVPARVHAEAWSWGGGWDDDCGEGAGADGAEGEAGVFDGEAGGWVGVVDQGVVVKRVDF